MTTDHRGQVEELLADYRRSRDQLATVHRDLAAITASASSPDGLVTATVGAQGTLLELVLRDEAYRRHRPAQLAELIVQTTAAAAATAAERTYQTLAPVLPSDTDPAALVRGTADLRPEEIEPPKPTRAPRDDEDFEQVDSWMDVEVTQRSSTQRRSR